MPSNFQDLLNQTLDKLPEIQIRNLEKNLCVCNEVSKLDIIKTILRGAKSIEEIKKRTYATEGTACCQIQIERLIKAIELIDKDTPSD